MDLCQIEFASARHQAEDAGQADRILPQTQMLTKLVSSHSPHVEVLAKVLHDHQLAAILVELCKEEPFPIGRNT